MSVIFWSERELASVLRADPNCIDTLIELSRENAACYNYQYGEDMKPFVAAEIQAEVDGAQGIAEASSVANLFRYNLHANDGKKFGSDDLHERVVSLAESLKNAASTVEVLGRRDGGRDYGARYAETKHLNAVELNRVIRAELKALAPGFKFSVRSYGYKSICVEVKRVPAEFRAIVSIREEERQRDDREPKPWLSREAYALDERIEALLWSFNYNGSDMQSDYHDTRFGSSILWAQKRPEYEAAASKVETPRENEYVEKLTAAGWI